MSDILQLDPLKVKADTNVRYGLKKTRLERLMEDISGVGQVETPVQVYPATEADQAKGYTHILYKGFYRHGAVTKLNAKGAGLTLPAILVEAPDTVTRITRQIAENTERENMSPMDKAIAMKQLLDAGVAKIEVRRIFAVPGGKKGMKIQPASNSYVNMHVGFLDFPKPIQNLIHENMIGVGAANDLRTKHAPDTWDAILAKIEAARVKDIEKEEAEETKLLNEEKSATVKTQEAEAKVAEAATVATTVEAAAAKVAELSTKTADLFKEKNAVGLAAEDRKAKEAAFHEAESGLKTARKEHEAAVKAKEKADEKAKKAQDAAEAAKKKIEEARAAKAAKKVATPAAPAPVGQKDVNKAAAAVGSPGAQPVKLNANDIRDVIHNLTLPGTPDKIREIFLNLEKCILGVLTPKAHLTALKKLTGEK